MLHDTLKRKHDDGGLKNFEDRRALKSNVSWQRGPRNDEYNGEEGRKTWSGTFVASAASAQVSNYDQQQTDGEGEHDGSDVDWFIDRAGDTGSCSSGPPPAMHRQGGGTGGQQSGSQLGGIQGHGGGALYGDYSRRAYSYYDGEAGSSSGRPSYASHGKGGGSRHGGGQHGQRGGMSGGRQSERSFDAQPRQYTDMSRSTSASGGNRGGGQ